MGPNWFRVRMELGIMVVKGYFSYTSDTGMEPELLILLFRTHLGHPCFGEVWLGEAIFRIVNNEMTSYVHLWKNSRKNKKI